MILISKPHHNPDAKFKIHFFFKSIHDRKMNTFHWTPCPGFIRFCDSRNRAVFRKKKEEFPKVGTGMERFLLTHQHHIRPSPVGVDTEFDAWSQKPCFRALPVGTHAFRTRREPPRPTQPSAMVCKVPFEPPESDRRYPLSVEVCCSDRNRTPYRGLHGISDRVQSSRITHSEHIE